MRLTYSLRSALVRRHPFSCLAALPTPFPMVRMTTRKVVMGMVEGAGTASDRKMNASCAWVEWPAGQGAGETLAHRFLATREAAFRWNTGGMEHWIGRTIPRSSRTHRELSCGERRRRLGINPALFPNMGSAEEGRKRKQDKGSVSRHCVSDCLHTLFLEDRGDAARDSRHEIGGNSPFSCRDCETLGRRDA